MNYHCLSLVKSGFQVTMIGYAGKNDNIFRKESFQNLFFKSSYLLENKQIDQIAENKNINIFPLSPYPKILQGIYCLNL